MITRTTLVEDAGGAAGPGDLHVLVMSPDAFLSVPLPTSGFVDVGRSAKCPVRLDDPLASREHARLHASTVDGAFSLFLEDLGSANGTRVKDKPISPGELVPVLMGEAITIGSTVLMVQQNRPVVGLRRLWSHGYFESRLEDECARASISDSRFALARVRLNDGAPWTRVVPVLLRMIPLPHLFAAYGPRDYEILFVEIPADAVLGLMQALMVELEQAGIDARQGTAWFPRDGRSSDALLARASALVKPPAPPDGRAGEPAAIATSGAAMDRIRDLASRAAGAHINVLILGETGVGKDVLARTIHKLSGRGGDFVALNCAGLSASLIESELFGHEKGAFTGAAGARVGLLEAASGGTVFLDEIGEMPIALQAKLLRTIETRQVLPVGAVKPRSLDVRYMAATNRDLEAEVAGGGFRQDLFFRLNGISLVVPPLRARTNEIPALVETFVRECCEESGREPPRVSSDAMDYLFGYAWPGNIRELRNVIERALVLCDEGEIGPHHLPLDKMRAHPGGLLRSSPGISARLPSGGQDDGNVIGVKAPNDGDRFPWRDDPARVAERKRILDALEAHVWNQTRAAEALGMPRRTFVAKLEYFRIPRPQKGGGG